MHSTSPLIPAPPKKRVAAYLVDLGIASLGANIVGILGLLLAIPFLGLEAFQPPWDARFWIMLVVIAVLSVVCFHAYFIHFESRTGSTPGKRFFGLEVASLSGAPLSREQCVKRDLWRYWDCMLIFPGLRALQRADGLRRGDLSAKTQVVYRPELERKSMYLSNEVYDAWLKALGPASIPEELRDRFLRFAYPVFLLRTVKPSESDLEYWDGQITALWPTSTSSIPERGSRLLFFAESCFQNKVGP